MGSTVLISFQTKHGFNLILCYQSPPNNHDIITIWADTGRPWLNLNFDMIHVAEQGVSAQLQHHQHWDIICAIIHRIHVVGTSSTDTNMIHR